MKTIVPSKSTYTHNRRDADTCDAGGRVTRTVNGRGQVLDLTWNLRGKLVSVSTNGVFAEGYAYDALGRRVSTADGSGTVYHAYDGIHCVADLAADGALLRSYTWGSGMDIKRAQSPRRSRRATAILSPSRRDGARSGIPRRSGNCHLLAVTLYGGDSTNTLYAVTDPLGTVHALVASNGTSQLWFTYDSWGNITVASQPLSFSASQLRFTWQCREYSHATGLYNFRARWYDPASGRWLSKDPIGLEGGLNLYEAFGDNPVCFGDPEGEFALAIPFLSFGGIAQAIVSTGAAIVAAASSPVVIAVAATAVVVVGTVAIVSSSNSCRIENRGGAIGTRWTWKRRTRTNRKTGWYKQSGKAFSSKSRWHMEIPRFKWKMAKQAAKVAAASVVSHF